jgi:hypothetical protein
MEEGGGEVRGACSSGPSSRTRRSQGEYARDASEDAEAPSGPTCAPATPLPGWQMRLISDDSAPLNDDAM